MSAGEAEIGQLALLYGPDPAGTTWRVRPSQRARRLAVRVLPGGCVEIVVPRGTRPRTIEQFVSRHRGWIERKVDQYRSVDQDTGDGLPSTLRYAASGAEFPVAYVERPGPPQLELVAGALRLQGERARPAILRHVLQRFTMREAHATFSPWLSRLAAGAGLRYGRLQIRRQRTRWGSCSPSGTISLNACLMFQTPDVVGYLMLHELAHTRHMNHSRRFWRLVESLEPRWRELDRALSAGWRQVPAWALG